MAQHSVNHAGSVLVQAFGLVLLLFYELSEFNSDALTDLLLSLKLREQLLDG